MAEQPEDDHPEADVGPLRAAAPVTLEGRVVDDRPRPVPLRAVHAVGVIARHEHTRKVGRNVGYIGTGAAVVARRLWESRSTARYERYIRSAEAAGDREAALEWEKQRAVFLRDRHQRRADLIRLRVTLAKELPKIALGVVVVFAAIGVLLAVATRRIGELAVPFEVAAHIAEWVAIAFSVSWGRSCSACRGSSWPRCGGPGAATRTPPPPGGRWPGSRTAGTPGW